MSYADSGFNRFLSRTVQIPVGEEEKSSLDFDALIESLPKERLENKGLMVSKNRRMKLDFDDGHMVFLDDQGDEKIRFGTQKDGTFGIKMIDKRDTNILNEGGLEGKANSRSFFKFIDTNQTISNTVPVILPGLKISAEIKNRTAVFIFLQMVGFHATAGQELRAQHFLNGERYFRTFPEDDIKPQVDVGIQSTTNEYTYAQRILILNPGSYTFDTAVYKTGTGDATLDRIQSSVIIFGE